MKPIMHNPNGEGFIVDKKSRIATRKAVINKSESCVVGERTYYYCHYCGTPMLKNSITVDHIIPKSKGGSYTVSNLVVSCKGCNRRKGDKDYFEFVDNIKSK